jgi:CubicO group peptidase (beta-lactamase class C family)
MESLYPKANPVLADSAKIDFGPLDTFVQSKVAHCADLDESFKAGVDYQIPGLNILVSRGGETLLRKAYGSRKIKPQVSAMLEETVFDIGSLTEALVASPLAMKLVDRGLLEVDRKLSRIFQTFGVLGKDRMTIKHLLSHCSGFPASIPFYRRIAKANRGERFGIMFSSGAVDEVYNEIFRSKLEHIPGKHMEESQVGYILLGHAVEIVGGMPLDRQAMRVLFGPYGLQSTGYIRLASLRREKLEPVNEIIAPSGFCDWRDREICGEVWDENVWVMGGVSGHSGVFSTIDDVNALCSEFLACWHGRGTLVNQEVQRLFWTAAEEDPSLSWALGWNTPSKNAGCGKHFSRFSVGHDAHTGSSVWIDPQREIIVTVLCNAGHVPAGRVQMKAIRPQIHDIVMECLGIG